MECYASPNSAKAILYRKEKEGVTKHPQAPRESILEHNNMGLSSKRESSSAIKHNWKIGELSSLF